MVLILGYIYGEWDAVSRAAPHTIEFPCILAYIPPRLLPVQGVYTWKWLLEIALQYQTPVAY